LNVALYHNLPSGGARRGMVEMAKGLVARGHVVDEYCPATADVSFLPLAGTVRRLKILPFRAYGVCPRRLPLLTPYVTAARLCADLGRLSRLSRQAAREIDAGGYDVVFSHDCQLAQNPAVLRFVRTPSLHYCHHGARAHLSQAERSSNPGRGVLEGAKRAYYAAPRALYPWLLTREARQNIECATLVATNSQFSVESLFRVYGVGSRVCFYGIDSSTFRPMGLERDGFVLSVGALHVYKGYRFLVRALGRIPSAKRPRLLIAANSTEPDERTIIEALASEHGVPLAITCVRDDEELARLYNRAAAFVYAPVMEPWGLAPVEAMACGTPVVAVAEGGVRESVVHGETGLLTERDEREFAGALSAVLADAGLARRLGTAGLSRARGLFTWHRTVDRVEELMAAARG